MLEAEHSYPDLRNFFLICHERLPGYVSHLLIFPKGAHDQMSLPVSNKWGAVGGKIEITIR